MSESKSDNEEQQSDEPTPWKVEGEPHDESRPPRR
jgi:hypothetical protein